MSQRRYTVTTLKAGQSRAYADTIRVTRILYEWQGMEGFSNPDAPFVRSEVSNEEIVRRDARHYSGWSEPTDPHHDHFSTRLEYLKMIEPGLWEWKTLTPYDD